MVFDPTTGGDTQPQGDQPTAAPMPEEQRDKPRRATACRLVFRPTKRFTGFSYSPKRSRLRAFYDEEVCVDCKVWLPLQVQWAQADSRSGGVNARLSRV